jgi:mRNA-degrading endonuclease RelE of RelBE toxin-antitoxin system
MSYRLRYDRDLLRQIQALPGDLRGVARRMIGALAQNPYPPAAKELDEHPGYYRLWLPRNHRLVYTVLADEQVVDILYLGPKPPDLYTRLGLSRQK